MIEVALESAPSPRRKAIFGLRHAAGEGFLAGHVSGLLELAGVHAEVSVGGIEHFFELGEGQRIVHCQHADDGQARTLVNEPLVGSRGSGSLPAENLVDLARFLRRFRRHRVSLALLSRVPLGHHSPRLL